MGFELNTNVETFDVECSETWIRKALKGRGLTAYPLSFVVEANPEEASRSAIITIIGGQAKQQVEVVQAGLSSLKTYHYCPFQPYVQHSQVPGKRLDRTHQMG